MNFHYFIGRCSVASLQSLQNLYNIIWKSFFFNNSRKYAHYSKWNQLLLIYFLFF